MKRIAQWIVNKLSKRYGLGVSSSIPNVVYKESQPIDFQERRIVPRDYAHSEKWMEEWIKEELLMKLKPFINVKAEKDPYSQQAVLEARITVYKRDAE